ncbi:hypothetical protein ACTWP5_14555 [Streptomyces sp. 4N509B]|uniref:hypothetical protein n=1 Tax=Streptomyces sp. 4N509B TaxID=3457413 RepID=UPI003FD329B2
MLLADDAEAAINRDLSEPLRSDPRLVVNGSVSLTITDDSRIVADERIRAAQREQQAMAGLISHLEGLRELLLDRHLGIVWWIERYADCQFAVGDPAAKTASLLRTFRMITGALAADQERSQSDVNAVIKARVAELLAALDDPVSGRRVLDLLETMLRTLTPPSQRVGGEAQGAENGASVVSAGDRSGGA